MSSTCHMLGNRVPCCVSVSCVTCPTHHERGACAKRGSRGLAFPPKRLKEQMVVEEGEPSGPTTVAELNRWPAHLLASIRAKDSMMAEPILSKYDGGVVTGSDYSGMGCMEQASAMTQQAVEQHSPSPRCCFEVHWVCDNDPRCRHVLRSHAAEREHCKHSFSDICDGIDSSILPALQGASRRWAAAAKRGALASESVPLYTACHVLLCHYCICVHFRRALVS